MLLLQNYPNHILYTRNFMTVVRDTGAGLRNALAARLQSLSIGYHTRASSSVVQTKVVRDVENVELMLQQVTHPLLSSVMVLTGAIVMTAVVVPEFLPVYALTVPFALLLRWGMARRSRARNEVFRREVEAFAGRVGEMASLIPVTRAHGLEQTAVSRVSDGADEVRRAGLHLDMLNGHVASISWVGMQLLGVGCLGLAAVFSLTGIVPITPGEVVLLSSYFALLTQGLTQLLMLIPVGARGLESVRSIAEVLQEPDLEQNEGKRRVDRVAGEITLRSRLPPVPGLGGRCRARRVARDPPRRDGGLRRLVGFGQVDAAEPRARLRPSDRGHDPARRNRHAGARPAHGAPLRVGRAAGVGALRGQHPRQHRLRPARARATRRSTRRCAMRTRSTSSRRSRTAGTRSSANAARGSPAASASGWRSPARSCAIPASCCSTRRRARSTRSPSSSSRRRSRA